MSFINLPDTVLLKVFEYLPFEDGIRMGRVSHRLHEMSKIIISKTKDLNLNDWKFKRLTPIGLASLVDKCKNNLETVTLRSQLAAAFSAFSCPRLVTVDMYEYDVECGADAFGALIKNNQNLERVSWITDQSLERVSSITDKPPMEYPLGVVSENLLDLELGHCDDAWFAALSGHCPNLRELRVEELFVNGKVLDQFFASSSKLETVCFVKSGRVQFDSLINFWRLPSLRNLEFGTHFGGVLEDNNFLVKISESFPQLQKLRLRFVDVANAGIAALAALPNLYRLELRCIEDSEIDASMVELATRGRLEYLILDLGTVSAAAVVVNLFRFCPNLYHLHVGPVEDIDTTNDLIELFRQIGSLPGQKTSVELDVDFRANRKRICDVLDEIANGGGRRILFH